MRPTLIALLAMCLCLPLMGADKDKPLPKDFKSLKALAGRGDARAQFHLAIMFYDGEGVEQSLKEAAKWTRKAAEQRYAQAQYVLGLLYANGQGVEKDVKEKAKWYRKAAEQGHADAQVCLGFCYAFFNQGVPTDILTAYAWYYIAASNGELDGKIRKDNISKDMTAEQIAKAEALVKEMVKKNPKLLNKK